MTKNSSLAFGWILPCCSALLFPKSSPLVAQFSSSQHALAYQAHSLSTRRFLSISDSLASSDCIKSYHLTGIGTKSRIELFTNTGHVLQTDVPKKMGGTNTAPQPVETLLAALLGCTQATAVYVGRHMEPRVLVERLEFDVTAYRDERGALDLPISRRPSIPARLQSVEGTVTVYLKNKNQQLSSEEIHLLAEQTEARCPVANMMAASGCKMLIQWKVEGSQ